MTFPRRLTAALLVLLVLTAAAGHGGRVVASENEAALVVDYGDGTVTYAVLSFEGTSISGFELLRKSGLSLVSIPFGGLGEAVCSIDSHGCPVGDCRRLCQTSDPESPFWQYFRLTEDGSWQAQSRGASGSTVEAGDIDGWSWTGTEPALPDATFEEIAARAGEPAGDDNVRLTTYDAAGTVVSDSNSDPAWSTYFGAALLIGGLVAVVVITRQRRAKPGPRP